MNTEYQFEDRSNLPRSQGLSEGMEKHTNQSTGAMDILKRDRFELLSAYLDGEVTAAERRLIEQWLDNEPEVQRLYVRLLKLRQGLRRLPVPEQQPVEETIKQVTKRISRGYRQAIIYGSAAVAACVIGAVGNLLSGGDGAIVQMAIREPQQQSSTSSDSSLMVAINSPVFPIPKAEISPDKAVGEVLNRGWDVDIKDNDFN
ncbi:transcriptional regulator [Mastigocoleus sp. MO_188.B34]|uniref:anti-sigma factor family protein n=1 Tax=Mastigocoleus sp. MO_188.B34 TaxID=3036635 RepID=UPI00262AF79B|nr:transcriptional regulator [Mastigocoleus sp. MO_188.B34]MDJ0693511.1 transcriptional regulator [Mastigocoleus sp. MO_188.B34]